MIAKILHHLRPLIVSMLAILLCFAVLDGIWLGLIAQSWYQTEMASLLRNEFIQWPWLVFYLSYSAVVLVLTVIANREKPWWYAGIDGAFLGLASYGAYNLTNYSIIEGYSLFITLVDWSWGIFVTSMSAIAGWWGFNLKTKPN